MLLQWIGMTSEITSSMTHRIKGWVLKQGLFDLGFQSTRPRRWSF